MGGIWRTKQELVLQETGKGRLATTEGDEMGTAIDLLCQAKQPPSSPGVTETLKGCHSRVSGPNLVLKASLYIQGSVGLAGLETAGQLGS